VASAPSAVDKKNNSQQMKYNYSSYCATLYGRTISIL
jgi:hypothetical protein